MEKFYPEFSARFQNLLPGLAGRRIAVIGHARPDGDCIGSQVALARVLAARGCDAVCVNPDHVPKRLRFLAEGTHFLQPDAFLSRADGATAMFVDCADGHRAGEQLAQAFPRPFAMVDHHLSNPGFADHNFLDAGSAATAEILAGMFLYLGVDFDRLTAQALYAGIATDTGQFQYPSTTRRTFSLAGALIERGAQPAAISHELYDRESPGRMQLLQRFLASLQFECGGRLCVGTLPRGIFAETGTTGEDTERLVDYARSVEGVEVGVLVEEREDGTVKASLRASNGAYRVDQIAAQFGGGGHACAAGLHLKQGTGDFRARLVAAVAARLRAVDAGGEGGR